MNIIVEIIIRSVLAFVMLFIITELLGAKHIAQLTFFDYAVGITLGSIAGTLTIDDQIPEWQGAIALAIFAVLSITVSFINRKTIWGRRLFTGNPIFLISNGQIMYKEIKRAQFNVNDVLRELRTQGYFNIADIHYAILETNGLVSVLPKTPKRPLELSDMNIKKEQESIVSNVIIDKKVMHGNLAALGKDEDWLMLQLKKQKRSLKEIALATLDDQGDLSVYPINNGKERRTVFQ